VLFADSYVVETAVVAECDGAGFADSVVSDPVVGVGCVAWAGFGSAVVDGVWCGPFGEGSVGSVVVVDVDELVDQGL